MAEALLNKRLLARELEDYNGPNAEDRKKYSEIIIEPVVPQEYI